LVEEGTPVPVILAAIEREKAELVVLGLARLRPFGGVGRTADELFWRSPVSVLVVKRRVHGPYGHVLVGTDFTEEARRGFELAAQPFPDAVFALMHAYELPYRSLSQDNQLSRDFGEMERATIRSFVHEAEISDELRRRVITCIEHGSPEPEHLCVGAGSAIDGHRSKCAQQALPHRYPRQGASHRRNRSK
jgi:nucleotide-binding universal stress UspA family protein